MIEKPSGHELESRIARLFGALKAAGRRYDTAIIADRVNQYYLTGTMQDGLLVLRQDGTVIYFVRKSLDRAMWESPLPIIRPMVSYRDMLAVLPANLGITYLETGIVPLALLERLRRCFVLEDILPLDTLIMNLRSVKSEYELGILAESGRLNQELLDNVVPSILSEGMSEADFHAEMYSRMVKLGHQGVSRLAMFQMEMIAGQIGFGENSVYPTNFNGPGGMRGQSPAVPTLGSRTRFLKKGDLVFADIGFGVEGYHSDKTRVYSFGASPLPEVSQIHQACLAVLNQAVGMLTAGRIPEQLYQSIIDGLPPVLQKNFMGFGQEQVRFIGHGVGLQIDEPPVLANGFKQPLQENMVIAIEPKCGIAGVGTVGVEETFVIKPDGPVCLTGGARDIQVVRGRHRR